MPESAAAYIFLACIFILFISAAAALFFSTNKTISRYITYISSIAASLFGMAASLIKLFDAGKPILLELKTNIEFLSISFYIDSLSAFFILIVTFLTLVVSIYSLGYVRHYEKKRNTAVLGSLYNLFTASMLLVVASGHIFFFLAAWEIMSLASYFLVVYENEKPEVQKAGIIYLVMTHVGTAFITAAFALLYKYTGQTGISLLNAADIPVSVKNIVFICLLIGFGTKAGVIPLHIWLPYAHPAAPSNVSALMSGVMIKTAVYGIVRFIIGSMSADILWWGTAILIVGAVSTVLGVAYALMEHNIKRLLAYHSIENIGIIFMGIGLSIIATVNGSSLMGALALTAALFHTFNHSVFKGLLFLGAGAVHYSTGTKDIEKLGGLIKKMPYTSVFFLAGALAISAIPPFNGFISEWLTYQSMLQNIASSNNLLKLKVLASAALLALAGALAAYCFVKVYGIAFLGLPRTPHSENAKEVPASMLAGMGVLSFVCLAAGIFPLFMIKLLDAVNLQFFGTTLTGRLEGFSCFISLPVTVGSSGISPLGLVFLMAMMFSVLYFIVSSLTAKTGIRKYNTWDCGYGKLDSRMQYTATGFSKPVRIVFRAIFRPQRELKVEEGGSPYFIKSAEYKVSTQSVFEKYIYEPFVRFVFTFARKARYAVQTGSIHTYLLYIFAAIILMLVYYVLTSSK